MRRLIFVLALSLFASPALSTTRWAYWSGTGDSTGSDSSNAMRLATALAATGAGDVIRLRHSVNFAALTLAADGSSGSPVRVIGDTLYPGSIAVSSYTPKSYVNLYGLTIGSAVSLGAATTGGGSGAANDSLVQCVIAGGTSGWQIGNSGHVLRNCTITGGPFSISGYSGTGCATTTPITGVEIINSTINGVGSSGSACMVLTRADGVKFTRTHVNLLARSTDNHGLMKFYQSDRFAATDCWFNLQVEDHTGQSCDECGTSYWRDHSESHVFTRDTFDLRGPWYNLFLTSASGTCPPTSHHKWDHCLFRDDAPIIGSESGHTLYAQNNTYGDTIQFCTFISSIKSPVEWDLFVQDSTVFRNNTVVYLGPPKQYRYNKISTGSPGLTKYNVWYAPNSSVGDMHPDGAAGAVSDSNMFYNSGGSTRAIRRTNGEYDGDPNGSVSIASYCGEYGAECNSWFDNPLFKATAADTGVWTFDATPTSSSPAIGRGPGGSTLGALYPNIELVYVEITFTRGIASDRTFLIRSKGQSTLKVGLASSTNKVTVSPAHPQLHAGEQKIITLHYGGSQTVPASNTVEVTSNDVEEPLLYVPFTVD